jgi:hypothetical protein
MAPRLPPGSKPIDETDWSADHRSIKDDLNLSGRDSVYIDPDGNVWVYHPSDHIWSNEGYAGDYTGSGQPSRPRRPRRR